MNQSNTALLSDGLHKRTCSLCEAMCGLEINMKSGSIESIKGDKADPLSRGHICPKAIALQDLQDDPDRLKLPIKKMADGSWQQISWAQAIQESAQGLAAASKKHGRNSVASYLGNPNVHNYGNLLFGPLLLRSIGSKNKYSATSVDQLPHHMASFHMLGHQLLIPVPDIDRTDFFIIWGGNPMASNGSLMTVPDIKKRLAAIRARGGKVIVIDPRYSETAAQADQHIFIRPGADVLLLLAILHEFCFSLKDQLPDLANYISTDNDQSLQVLADLGRDFSAESVAEKTSVPASVIKLLAKQWLESDSAAVYGRMGVSVQKYGGLCQWLLNCLNIVSGNFDRPGGVMFTDPAVDVVGYLAKQGSRGHYNLWQSRVRKLPEFAGEFPVATMAQEMLVEGEGQIKALLTMAGNPVLSTPNGQQLEQGLEQLDFMVAIDYYLNETTAHADIILPPKAPLEKDHYDLIFHTMAVRNTAKYSPALFSGEKDSRADWQIILDLNKALLAEKGKLNFSTKMTLKLLSWLEPKGMLNLMMKYSFLGGGKGLSIKKLQKAPSGVDLSALTPCMPERLFHKDKKLQLTPKVFVEEMQRVKQELLDLAISSDGLVLIGRRHVRSNNSWMHNSKRLMKGKNRCTLLMHPQDAERLSLQTGQQVSVSSKVGQVKVELQISEEIMQGVVSLPHGFGHHRKGTQQKIAEQYAGVSVNDLTDEMEVDQLTGNAVLNAVPVSVVAG